MSVVHRAKFVAGMAVGVGFLLAACSSERAYDFNLEQNGETIHLSGSAEDVHHVVSRPYLTVNFRLGDPHLSLSLYEPSLTIAQAVQLPCVLEKDGVRVAARFGGRDFSSEVSGSDGTVTVHDFKAGDEMALNVSLDVRLASALGPLRVTGTADIK